MPGIIHGSSGSGASLFVEPLPAVELNNDIVSLGDDERAEVLRILRELTSRVGDRAGDLALAVDVLGELDAAQALALTARDMDANEPEIADGRLDLELISARHPLLMPAICKRLGLERRSTREPVPVTLRVGFGQPVLVISGPNTGGKTVALKTAGLLRPHGAVRPVRARGAGQRAARVPTRLRRHRRRAVDRGEPLHVLGPPGHHRGR